VVLFSFKRAIAVVALSTLTALTAWPQAKQPQWKDRAEYDLYDSISKEQNPQTKLGLLGQWKEKYPASEYKDLRSQTLLDTHRVMNNAKGMYDTAKDITAENPKNFLGLYWLNLLTVSMNDKSEPALAAGEKAGKDFLAIMDDTFSPTNKKAEVSEDAWKKERATTESLAYRTLGWVAMQRNQNEEAEKNFVEVLKRNPADTQVSLFTGTVIARQRKLEKQSAALYHFARAGAYDGQGALPQQLRDQMKGTFEKNYVNFHGDKEGMDKVMEAAKASALPPDDFKILSKDEILIGKEEELKKSNPVLALWVGIKRQLQDANGAQYFDGTLKNAAIPGGVDVGGTKVEKLKGTLISHKPAVNPKELVVGISSPEMSEVTIRLETPLRGKAPAGTPLEFAGAPVEFTPDPFNLVFEVENKDLTGWPAQAAAPKPGGAKKGGKK
jgi:tetratricopeptide (TPR) repeat protein